MESKLVYLAGPIDQAGREEPWTIRRRARQCLQAVGCTIFDPSTAFDVPADIQYDSPELYRINCYAISRCDGVLALLPRGVPTIGTPIEIDRAWMEGLPVAIVGGQQSFQLAGMLDEAETIARFTEIGEAVAWLARQMQQGKESERFIRMPVKNLGEGTLPSRQYQGDAGFDLYVSEQKTIAPGQFVDVPCSIAVEFPDHCWGMIVGRSSTLRKRGLLVSTGIIDQGYRGQLYAGIQNLGDKARIVQVGERLAQLLIFPLMANDILPVWADTLRGSDRGEGGFGSTGT